LVAVTQTELLHLLGEKTALERMLAETPADDVIDRASLNARLATVERALAQPLHEEEAELQGTLQGVLPGARVFEFKLAGSEQVIEGEIGPAVVDPSALTALLHHPIRVRVAVTRAPSGRTRYVLVEPLHSDKRTERG